MALYEESLSLSTSTAQDSIKETHQRLVHLVSMYWHDENVSTAASERKASILAESLVKSSGATVSKIILNGKYPGTTRAACQLSYGLMKVLDDHPALGLDIEQKDVLVLHYSGHIRHKPQPDEDFIPNLDPLVEFLPYTGSDSILLYQIFEQALESSLSTRPGLDVIVVLDCHEAEPMDWGVKGIGGVDIIIGCKSGTPTVDGVETVTKRLADAIDSLRKAQLAATSNSAAALLFTAAEIHEESQFLRDYQLLGDHLVPALRDDDETAAEQHWPWT